MQNTHGGVLFNEKDGWPSSAGVEGEEAVLDLSADKRLFSYSKSIGQLDSNSIIDSSMKMENISTKKVIELLFGKFPDRKYVSRHVFQESEYKPEDFDLDLLRENELIENSLKEAFDKFQETDFIKDRHDNNIIKNIEVILSE